MTSPRSCGRQAAGRGRVWRGAALAVIAVAALGCSDDTGILLSITREGSGDLEPLVSVEVVVGVTDGMASTPTTNEYMGDPRPDQKVDVTARDLTQRPLTMLLKPGDELPSDAEILVVALGRNAAGDVKAVGVVEADDSHKPRSIGFVADTVVEWDVVLQSLNRVDGSVSPLGCVTVSRSDGSWVVVSPDDRDCDDSANAADCRPDDPAVHPGATENCTTAVDEDCDGDPKNETDRDKDGVTNCAGDCRDNDPNTFKGAPERCDGIDNDCSAATPCDPDEDGDGYSTCGTVSRESGGTFKCEVRDPNRNGTCDAGERCDCKPREKEIHPSASERCDGFDNNCDAECDPDPDHDGLTTCGTITYTGTTSSCSVTERDGCAAGENCDCRENDAREGGPRLEVCDGLDGGCDDVLYRSDTPCFARVDANKCVSGHRACNDTSDDYWGDCTPVDNATPVDPSLCAKFEECDDETDVFACMTRINGACTIDVKDGKRCEPATHDLSPGLNLTCDWTLIGGTQHGPWKIGLRSRGSAGDTSAHVDMCDAQVVVEDQSASVADAEEIHVLLLRHSPPPVERNDIFNVKLTAKVVAACEPGSSLRCTLSPAPQ